MSKLQPHLHWVKFFCTLTLACFTAFRKSTQLLHLLLTWAPIRKWMRILPALQPPLCWCKHLSFMKMWPMIVLHLQLQKFRMNPEQVTLTAAFTEIHVNNSRSCTSSGLCTNPAYWLFIVRGVERKQQRWVASYLLSPLSDQHPDILAPAQSSRVMSASQDSLLPSSLSKHLPETTTSRPEESLTKSLSGIDRAVLYSASSDLHVCSLILCSLWLPERRPRCSSMWGTLRGSTQHWHWQQRAAWLV